MESIFSPVLSIQQPKYLASKVHKDIVKIIHMIRVVEKT